jgi:hypothetical protein
MSPAEVFARNFERLALFFGRHGECHTHRIPDAFDGRAFGPKEFSSFTEPYLARVDDFYSTSAEHADIHRDELARVNPGYSSMVFESPHKSRYSENDRVPFAWFHGAQRSRRAIAFAPGWPRQDQRLEERIARRFRSRGIDVALLTVPFHLARTPLGAYSGEYFISSNPLWTIENFRQFVAEIRLVVRWLRERYESVGLFGLSSGGVHAGLAAYCEDIDFYAPVMSASDLGGLMWDSSITKGIREQLLARGIKQADLEKYWAIADISRLRAPMRAKNILQIITRYDGIIPLDYQLKLWRALGEPDRVVLPTSHFGIVFCAEAVADLTAAFIEKRAPLPARAA